MRFFNPVLARRLVAILVTMSCLSTSQPSVKAQEAAEHGHGHGAWWTGTHGIYILGGIAAVGLVGILSMRRGTDVGFSHLRVFVRARGHAHVPSDYRTRNGFRLGQWVITQRANKDTMSPDRRQRLEAVDGWEWGDGDQSDQSLEAAAQPTLRPSPRAGSHHMPAIARKVFEKRFGIKVDPQRHQPQSLVVQ